MYKQYIYIFIYLFVYDICTFCAITLPSYSDYSLVDEHLTHPLPQFARCSYSKMRMSIAIFDQTVFTMCFECISGFLRLLRFF